MGNSMCCEFKVEKTRQLTMNEGENFIREILNTTKLSNYTVSELHKILMNKDLLEIEEINETNYYIDVTTYSNIAVKHLYENNQKINKYSQIHSIFFSFIASSFQQSITKINSLNLLREFLIFTKSGLEDKIKYFYTFSKRKLLTKNTKESLKALLLEHLRFILKDITYEMSILVFNEGKEYMDNLNSMNYLCKVCNEENLDKFINDYILINVNFTQYSPSNIPIIEKELIDFLCAKNFLFDFSDLRDIYFSVFLKK
jgi:hypothetical protein